MAHIGTIIGKGIARAPHHAGIVSRRWRYVHGIRLAQQRRGGRQYWPLKLAPLGASFDMPEPFGYTVERIVHITLTDRGIL